MAEAFIKIYKKMLEWEWYDDTNTKILFLHCLLRANWKPARWHGIEIEPGQFITSLATLAAETHLSVKQVRKAIEHLKQTGEVADQRHANCRVITVIKWNEYQGQGKPEGNPKGKPRANLGQTEGKLGAIDKEYKEKEEEKEVKELKSIYGEYRHVLLTDRERDLLFNDYGEAGTLEAIKFLDEYIEMKGYKAKSHYLCLKKWVFDAVKEKKPKQSLAEQWLNA